QVFHQEHALRAGFVHDLGHAYAAFGEQIAHLEKWPSPAGVGYLGDFLTSAGHVHRDRRTVAEPHPEEASSRGAPLHLLRDDRALEARQCSDYSLDGTNGIQVCCILCLHQRSPTAGTLNGVHRLWRCRYPCSVLAGPLGSKAWPRRCCPSTARVRWRHFGKVCRACVGIWTFWLSGTVVWT